MLIYFGLELTTTADETIPPSPTFTTVKTTTPSPITGKKMHLKNIYLFAELFDHTYLEY